jgi:hypothetical protein
MKTKFRIGVLETAFEPSGGMAATMLKNLYPNYEHAQLLGHYRFVVAGDA